MTKQQQVRAVGLAVLLGASSLMASAKSPLADAAEKSERATIRTLLKQHSDVNAPQADGMTALHWAAHLDDLEIARLLVKAGAMQASREPHGVAPFARVREREYRIGGTSSRRRRRP